MGGESNAADAELNTEDAGFDIKSLISVIAGAGSDITDEKFEIKYSGCDAPGGACDPKGANYIVANDSCDVGLAEAAN